MKKIYRNKYNKPSVSWILGVFSGVAGEGECFLFDFFVDSSWDIIFSRVDLRLDDESEALDEVLEDLDFIGFSFPIT